MKEEFDVAIVGAGPAGISAAYILAGKGIKTIVFERGEYPGAKNISGGVLYGHDLAEIVPDFVTRNCPVERNIVESTALVSLQRWRVQRGFQGQIILRPKAIQLLYRGKGKVRPVVRG